MVYSTDTIRNADISEGEWVRLCVCVVFICPPVNVAVWMKVHELMTECSRLFLLPEQHSGFIICKSSVNCVKSGLLDAMRGSASGLCNSGCCRSCDDSNKDINSLLSSIITTKNNTPEGRAIKWRKWEKSARDYVFCTRLCWYQENILLHSLPQCLRTDRWTLTRSRAARHVQLQVCTFCFGDNDTHWFPTHQDIPLDMSQSF